MKKLAIYIAYHPPVSLNEDGLGRYLSFMLQGAAQNGYPILIAMPSWTLKSLKILLADNKISLKDIELLTPGKLPIGLRVYDFLKNIKKNKSKKINPFLVGLKSCLRHLTRLIKFYLHPKFVLSHMLIQRNIALIMVESIGLAILSPVLLLLWIIKVLCKLLITGLSKVLPRFTPYRYLTEIISRVIANSPMNEAKISSFIQHTFRVMYKKETDALVKKLNNRDDILGCIVPTLFWPEIKDIKHKKITICPDIIFFDFPSIFQGYRLTYEKISQTVAASDQLVCHSEHVKQNHLLKNFLLSSQQITVIKHAPSVVENFLDLHRKFSVHSTVEKRDICLQILQLYQKQQLFHNLYLYNFDFSNTRFIFYASQLRPHKNIFNLIDMYEILLRKRYVNVKLILTGRFDYSQDVYNYIAERGLQEDVISLPSLPTETLAALYYLALCTVNPSFFEGGFPFTFTEAYSVGTPSIMSAIPVTLEEVQDKPLREVMLFDPYNVNDMADKVEWGINHREQLFLLQKPLFERFSQRSWADVAKEYFQKFSDDHTAQSDLFPSEASNSLKNPLLI